MGQHVPLEPVTDGVPHRAARPVAPDQPRGTLTPLPVPRPQGQHHPVAVLPAVGQLHAPLDAHPELVGPLLEDLLGLPLRQRPHPRVRGVGHRQVDQVAPWADLQLPHRVAAVEHGRRHAPHVEFLHGAGLEHQRPGLLAPLGTPLDDLAPDACECQLTRQVQPGGAGTHDHDLVLAVRAHGIPSPRPGTRTEPGWGPTRSAPHGRPGRTSGTRHRVAPGDRLSVTICGPTGFPTRLDETLSPRRVPAPPGSAGRRGRGRGPRGQRPPSTWTARCSRAGRTATPD